MSLQINQLSFSYDTACTIKDLSLVVQSGEFVSLIGPSGCGKSTLFKVIGGLYSSQQGEVWLNQSKVNGEKGHIGYMPQQYSLFPWLTVEENIRLGQKVNNIKDGVDVHEWLRKAKLEGIATSYPSDLSGGMQQRVAFIRTLASNKELLCLDEPFSALDALTRVHMYEWMNSLREWEKRTILFITHSVEEAMLLSDRIYLLSDKPMKIIAEKVVPFPRKNRSLLQGKEAWNTLYEEILCTLLGK